MAEAATQGTVHALHARRRDAWKRPAAIAAAIVAFAAAGGSVTAFLRPSLVASLGLETAEAHASDIERIERRMEAFEVSAEKNTARIIEAIKGSGRRR